MSQPAQHNPFDYLTGRGDMRFAPPEFLFWQGRDNPRAHKCADIYGLGSLLCEVVTGQGITSLALGIGPEIAKQTIQLAQANQRIDLSTLRGSYQYAYRLFEESTPSPIRQQALRLLKQLCDPVPEMRLPFTRSGKRQIVDENLTWLLRSADILIKRLEQSGKMAKRAHAAVGGKL